MTKYKSGNKVPRSGQYNMVKSNGKKIKEVTSTKGEPFPPTVGRNQHYTLADPTKNKSGGY